MQKKINWNPPSHWLQIETLDMHTGGEPLRIISGGLPEIKGRTILEKIRYFRSHYDHLRTALLWEPRGHADMYGAILTEPVTPGSDFGVIFLHNEGYSTMCGHATLALARMALETRLVSKISGERNIFIDAPAGRLTASWKLDRTGNGKGNMVSSFLNVPSFVLGMDETVMVKGIGKVKFDLAFGGAFYAFTDAVSLGLDLIPSNTSRLVDLGMKIKRAVTEKFPVRHPFEKDLSFLYGTIFTGPAHEEGHHSRNVCIFADGELDRSATGSGVSARAAIHSEKGELAPGEKIRIESILGTIMDAEIKELTAFGPHRAVIPEVSGKAWYTGRHTFWIDPEDPLRKGFLVK